MTMFNISYLKPPSCNYTITVLRARGLARPKTLPFNLVRLADQLTPWCLSFFMELINKLIHVKCMA